MKLTSSVGQAAYEIFCVYIYDIVLVKNVEIHYTEILYLPASKKKSKQGNPLIGHSVSFPVNTEGSFTNTVPFVPTSVVFRLNESKFAALTVILPRHIVNSSLVPLVNVTNKPNLPSSLLEPVTFRTFVPFPNVSSDTKLVKSVASNIDESTFVSLFSHKDKNILTTPTQSGLVFVIEYVKHVSTNTSEKDSSLPIDVNLYV